MADFQKDAALRRWLIATLALSLAVGMTGAITALGDTLFPIDPNATGSLIERLVRDLSPSEHFLVRLRFIHPFVSIAAGVLMIAVGLAVRRSEHEGSLRRWGTALALLVVVELAIGWLNVEWGAPGGLQIIHLLLADGIWIALVALSWQALARPPQALAPSDEGATATSTT